MSSPHKSYLGDGVYADFDGFAIKLTTENGISVTNEIILETQVMRALSVYIKNLDKAIGSMFEGDEDVKESALTTGHPSTVERASIEDLELQNRALKELLHKYETTLAELTLSKSDKVKKED